MWQFLKLMLYYHLNLVKRSFLKLTVRWRFHSQKLKNKNTFEIFLTCFENMQYIIVYKKKEKFKRKQKNTHAQTIWIKVGNIYINENRLKLEYYTYTLRYFILHFPPNFERNLTPRYLVTRVNKWKYL